MRLIVVVGPPIVLVGGTFPFALELKMRMDSGPKLYPVVT